MKINRQNFEDAPHGSPVFEDIKMLKMPKTQEKKATDILTFSFKPSA